MPSKRPKQSVEQMNRAFNNFNLITNFVSRPLYVPPTNEQKRFTITLNSPEK